MGTSANPKRQNRRSGRASNESGTQTTTQQDLCHHKTLCVERRALRETEVTRFNTCLSEKQAKEVFSLVPPLPTAATAATAAAWRRTWRRRETRASTSTRGPPRISSLTRF